MKDNLEIFRTEYINANTWAQRKEGVPLDLLKNLTADELRIAEEELIQHASIGDTWPIIGLGFIQSQKALPKLQLLLSQGDAYFKTVIAHAIFQINQDNSMIEVVLKEAPQVTNWYNLIDILYLLSDFKDKRTDHLLNNFRNHKEYLVAYNATSAMGLSTDEVVKKFRNRERTWWQKLFGFNK